MLLPRARAYIDWAIPVDKNGQEIGVCTDPDTFEFYIDWLADYLYETVIPVPECQQADLSEFQEADGISTAVFWTSDDLGSSFIELEIIEQSFNEKSSYLEYVKFKKDYYYSLSEIERQEIYDSEEECFVSEIEFNRICQETEQSLNVPSHIRHADIPYRPLFAKLMKSQHDKYERIKELRYFYANLNDWAGK
ncbi:MAG: hypothetical protein PHO37_11470 [Kiritimatiellae bacterium]|nr:hypothetical protein [Kiritimatiellia bacterium]